MIRVAYVLISQLWLLFAMMSPAYAFDSGGTGADGELAPQEDTVVVLPEDGILNYSSVDIPAGVKVSFARNRVNTPVRILVSGDVHIAGIVDVSGSAAAEVGVSGGGVLSDDGAPGLGGPGGYDGGAGGSAGPVNLAFDSGEEDFLASSGGNGKGPGGGIGARFLAVTGNKNLVRCDVSSGNHASSNHMLLYDTRCLPAGSSSRTLVIPDYGTESLVPLTGGSGGGGRAASEAFATAAGGGGGGGAILIAASGTVNISSQGSIQARGGNGNGAGGSGGGGAGSGGAVRIVATTITGSGLINVRGGTGGGGLRVGGVGRIRLEAETMSYRRSGINFSSSIPGPVFISNRPYLRIVSVASEDAPLAPSGMHDIVLDVATAPVQVLFAAANVPPGTVVSLQVLPDFGPAVTAEGGALTGTVASSSATAEVTLPAGHSVLSASASFTVQASDTATQSLYMPYTKGEVVARVYINTRQAALRILTVSGREVFVPEQDRG